jgi:hypothetical protein
MSSLCSFTTSTTYLRLEITVHNAMAPHQLHTRQHLHCESPDDGSRKPVELICFDKFVEVDTEQLGNDAEVTSEIEVIRHSDHVMLVLWVLSPVSLQHDVVSIDLPNQPNVPESLPQPRPANETSSYS